MTTLRTQVAIIGGGPAGLMLAIELGCRGVQCMVLEEDRESPNFPKANATSARTMEHYRRRGFSDEIRALGLPPDHAQDVMYCTRLTGSELARFRIPSRNQATQRSDFGDYGESAWPTPELPHRAQQMYIEPILKRQAERYPSVQVRFGCKVLALLNGPDQVVVEIEDAQGAKQRIEADYAVGCDGARSLTRKSLGINYAGASQEDRDFFGGQMLSIYFRSSNLYEVIGKPRAWQYWVVNPVQRGLLVSIDGNDTFLMGVQLKKGQKPEDLDIPAVSLAVVGAPFDMRIIETAPWLAGYTLVAERFGAGRVLLAGDAAHLFTPTGGMGYNTSIDDVVNLGWKLAAVLQGWAPPALLESYERERRPIAERNTGFARRMADSIGKVPVPAEVESASDAGTAARRTIGAALDHHVRSEFNIPGLQLGLRYFDSPIVARETEAAPPDDPNHYVPSGHAGGRAPHAVVGGKSLLDQFGRDFTLLSFDGAATEAWEQAAAQLRMPLAVLRVDDAQARALYGASLVLVRPDHHIAWRGAAGANAQDVLNLAIGAAQTSAQTPGAPPASISETRMTASTPTRRANVQGVHSLNRFVYTVPDLAVAEKFYTTFGLDVRRTPKSVQLYTFGNPHCWAEIFQAGDTKRLQYTSFGIYAEDEAVFRQRIAERGIACEPHPLSDGRGLWMRDPDGFPLQLVVAPKVSPSVKSEPTAVAPVPPGVGASPSRSRAGTVKPRRLSHILRFTPDVMAMVRFGAEVLGLRLSDHSGEIIAFTHGPHGSDHHLVAFAKSHAAGLHHSSWDVGSVQEVGLGAERMKEAGYNKGWGVGRHVLGSNYFYYVEDPWGSYCEYSYDIDFVPAEIDWQAGDHPGEDSIYVWGPAMPPEFITNQEVPAP